MLGKVSTTDSPRVWSSSPVRGSFFLYFFKLNCVTEKIRRVIMANAVPDPQASPVLLWQLDEEEAVPTLGLSMAERQAKLQEILESNGGFDGLEGWPPKVATSA